MHNDTPNDLCFNEYQFKSKLFSLSIIFEANIFEKKNKYVEFVIDIHYFLFLIRKKLALHKHILNILMQSRKARYFNNTGTAIFVQNKNVKLYGVSPQALKLQH